MATGVQGQRQPARTGITQPVRPGVCQTPVENIECTKRRTCSVEEQIQVQFIMKGRKASKIRCYQTSNDIDNESHIREDFAVLEIFQEP